MGNCFFFIKKNHEENKNDLPNINDSFKDNSMERSE